MVTSSSRPAQPSRRTPTRTIRVRADVHDRLQAMAAEHEQSIGGLLEEMIEQRRKAEFFARLEEDFRRLRADPEASAAYDAELALWDSTLRDGLDAAPWNET